MPTIKITDSLQGELVTASPDINSGLGSYLKNLPAQIIGGTDFVSQLRGDLISANAGATGFGLKFNQDVPLAKKGLALTVAAGSQAMIGVYNRSGVLLFDQTFVGAVEKVRAGQAYVSFAFHPSLELGVSGTTGDISFGFAAGSEAEFRCYRPFDNLQMPLADACKEVLENFTVPTTLDDLRGMAKLPEGSIVAVSGKGQLRVGASVNLISAVNPLASLDAIPKVGKIDLGGGASVTAGLKVTVSGGYQFRIKKLAGSLIQFAVLKERSSGFDVSLLASAGASLEIKDKDVLAMLPTGSPVKGEDEEDLVTAGLTKKQISAIKDGIKAGASKRITAELESKFSSLKESDTAFLYEIDLSALDATSSKAIEAALAGDLSGLNLLEPELPGHGIRIIESRTFDLSKQTLSLRMNLLGLVNVISIREFLKTGEVVVDEETGDLLITDEVTRNRVGAVTTTGKIRSLLYESALMTLSYKASGVDVNTDLKAGQTFFTMDRSANRHRVSDYLDDISAAGLMSTADIPQQLGANDDFGKSSLLLATDFDQTACEQVFLANGQPRTQLDYEAIGKQALLGLVAPDEPDAYRRIPLTDQSLWDDMKDKGPANFEFVLPSSISGGADSAVKVGVVRADYLTIMWWARAMATASGKLADMKQFLNGKNAADLEKGKDKKFADKREDLSKAVASSIKKNQPSFDDPWGLIALLLASRGAASATATVVTAKFQLELP